jgi:lysophospholipase L1-like esterase
MPRPAFRRLLARLVLLGFSALFGLLLAEFAVRLARPQPVMIVSKGLYEADPPRRYRLAPGFEGRITNRVEFDTPVTMNRAGLRGPEIGPKAAGTLRILALGDSFTFGVGARQEESYPARLQEILRARGVRAEVLNAGAPGYGVPDEAAWFAQWGRPLDPDALVIAVFVGNDLQDAAPGGPKVMAVDGSLVVQGEKRRSVSRWLYYHSHLFVLLKSSALGGPVRRLLGLPEPLETRERRAEFDLYERGALAKTVREGAAATERAVAGLARDAAPRKIVAVIIPSLIQVDPARWDSGLRGFGLDPARYDRNRPNEIFRGIFSRHGIPVVDLTQPFAAAVAKGERIYYPIDQHLTPAGYRLMAEQVANAF